MKKIFISYSEKDHYLVEYIYDILINFINDNKLSKEYEIFYARKKLTEDAGSSQWKTKIRNNMKESSYCLVVFTPNSVVSRWVNYELGLATASKNMKKIIPLSTKGIDFNLVINNEIQLIDIGENEGLIAAMEGIFENKNRIIQNWAKNNRAKLEKISRNAKQKNVYFVGSEPLEEKGKENSKWKSNVQYFVRNLATSLLKLNFKLASFPSVDHIGKLVATCALEKGSDYYEIAGLYEFDKQITEFHIKEKINPSTWNKTLENFREIYLSDKDNMIIIGGGDNTRNEHAVAEKNLKIQIFPIPCFGGFGQELYEKMRMSDEFDQLEHPCRKCYGVRENGPCPHVADIAKRLNKYKMDHRMKLSE